MAAAPSSSSSAHFPTSILQFERDFSARSRAAPNSCNFLVFKCRASASGRIDQTWKPAPMGHKSAYNDSWFDKKMIEVFVHAMSKASGRSTDLPGFDGFVDVTRKMMLGRSPAQQHKLVLGVLQSLMPSWIGAMLRTMMPASKSTAEFYAYGTTLFTNWLIGPSEVIEVEVDGVKQRSAVHVHKCRVLESSACVGLCTNMCKIPSQTFIAKELGIPMTMVPNFEDMSCQFIYGQTPPPLEEDPASRQPCYYGLCPTARLKSNSCPKL